MKLPLFGTAAAGTLLLGTVALTGCSKVEVHPTLSPAKFAERVAQTMGDQVGQETQADCGTASIKLINGNVIHCKLGPTSDPNTVYDATVTLSEVEGTDYHLDIKNSDTPISPDADLPGQSK